MRHAIVTGGAGLIGTAICRRLLAAGGTVARFDLAPGRSGAQELTCDIADKAAVDAAFERLGWSRLDLLVNNGGTAPSLEAALGDSVLYVAHAGFVTGETLTVDGGMTRKMIYAD